MKKKQLLLYYIQDIHVHCLTIKTVKVSIHTSTHPGFASGTKLYQELKSLIKKFNQNLEKIN